MSTLIRRLTILMLTVALAALTTGCGTSIPRDNHVRPNPRPVAAPESVKLSRVVGHIVSIPVMLNGRKMRFVLDTGIGVTLITKRVCQQIRCKVSGQFTGKRMSGQKITVPLSSVSSLAVGSTTHRNVTVGVFDVDLGPAFRDIGGFISLKFFETQPFTIDYSGGLVTIETPQSLAAHTKAGRAVKISVKRRGPSLDVTTRLKLPGGRIATVEVDSGSGQLILHQKYMSPLGFKPGAPNVKQRTGKDETGHTYQRYFTRLNGHVQLAEAPSIKHQRPKVMFQKIIYDGLLGTAFLRGFRVTFDLQRARMIFSPHSPHSP